MKRTLLLCLPMIACMNAFATTWHVGSTQTYTMPSQVSALVQNGDTVNIDAGSYPSDVAHWTANNLVLRGVNGMASLPSGGLTYGGKAIWVIGGNNTLVEYIEFSQAACTDMNGAGIRQEGLNLTVRHCFFHDNEEGILAGTYNPSNILIEYSEFAHNGAGDGYSHNLYINNIDTFTFRYNYSHDAVVGHELKSRANVNYILYNRISDEANGTASRSIDLPNGGTSYLVGNVIEQGPQTQNSNIIGYGLEGLINPSPNELYAVHNTIVNDRSGGSFFDVTPNADLFKAYNNIIAGTGNFSYGNLPSNTDTAHNVINTDTAAFHFVNALNYDYRLTSASVLAINAGSNPGTANNFSLVPSMTYVHPNNTASRCISGTLDVGAYEYCSASQVSEIESEETFYPNPSDGTVRFSRVQSLVVVTDMLGKELLRARSASALNLELLANGVYILQSDGGIRRVVIQH